MKLHGATPVVRVALDPKEITVLPWRTANLTARAYDAAGNQITDISPKWLSSSPSVVSVDASGGITGNYLGRAVITADFDGFSASMQVEVSTTQIITIGESIDMAPGRSTAETSVAINPIYPLNIAASANEWRYSSKDGGRTWQNGPCSEQAWVDPVVAYLPDGTFLRAGMGGDSNGQGITVMRSLDGGESFPRSQWAWAYRGVPDQPQIATDKSLSSPYRGSIYLILSDYSSSSPPYVRTGFGLVFSYSRDGGLTWSPPKDISETTDATQEASSTISVGPNGEVYAAWFKLNGNLYFKKSVDGGVSWSSSILVRSGRPPVSIRTGDVRGNPSIDVDRSSGPYRGTIYISCLDAGGVDALLFRSSDGGGTWAGPIFISDGPRAPYKYYFQPHISVASDGRIDAFWYDTRNWTGTNNSSVYYDLYYGMSTDGGKSFLPSIRITPKSRLKLTPPGHDRILYEYLGSASDDSRAVCAWTNADGSHPSLDPELDFGPYNSRVFFSQVWINPNPTPLPIISKHPVAQAKKVGEDVAFSVSAVSSSDITYQWFKNGNPISGATASSLTLGSLAATDAGSYAASVKNAAGSAVSTTAVLTVDPSSALSNMSVRTTMATGQTLIVGAVVGGGAKTILARAAGPSLNQFGLQGMYDPRLELYTSGKISTSTNDDWPPTLTSVFNSVGAFGFQTGSKDAALSQQLSGSFTVQAKGTGTGTVLVELYDVTGGTSSRLINVSARNRVGTGADVLIAGFGISGTGNENLLIRGIGPGLAQFGLVGTLNDPKIQVYDGSNNVVASNDNWDPSLASTFSSVGAFGLQAGSRDAAIVVSLKAGASYTVIVSGADFGTGEAIVEVYELP